MESTATKRQQNGEIHEAKYSLSSLLLNGRTFSILMSLAFLWFLFDITHFFGMADPYPSSKPWEMEPTPVDYWALVALFATVIFIWSVRRLCVLQKQFYDWAISGERYPHLKEYLQADYWVNVFKIFRTNKTTIISLAIFLIASVLVTILWLIDPPWIGFLGGIGFFEANDLVVAIFFRFHNVICTYTI